MTLPDRLTLKNPTDIPLERLVDFVRAYETSVNGTPTCSREDIVLETGIPGYRDNSWCLTDAEGELVAWAALTVRGGDTADCALTVLPGEHDEAAARGLLRILLNRADELGREQDTSYAVSVGGVLSGDTVVPPVLERDGFVRGTTYGRYDVALSTAPLPPVLPDQGSIRAIASAADTDAVHAVHLRDRSRGPKTGSVDLFRARLDRFREAGGIALVLEVAGRAAGYVLAIGQQGGGEGRIVELGVAPASRGLGVGLALVTAALAELRSLGSTRALIDMNPGEFTDHEGLRRVLAVQTEPRAVTRYHKRTA
ncbi:GNAT family N-acetyltransferase [Kitasatospora sp. NPDC018058]|uniref:GNAT family N-acetyltransferase n=1 Tax=Kitasatospora sp. NPDC018058 TaxID=3364025 RepID=UPI0037BF7F4D